MDGRRPVPDRHPRLLIYTTWADDGRWHFLNSLRAQGRRVDLLEPLLCRSRWAPAWLRSLAARACSLYQPFLALRRAGRYDAVVSWNTRVGTVHGLLFRLLPKASRPWHILRDFHLDMTRLLDPVYLLRLFLVKWAAPGVDFFLATSSREARLYADIFAIPRDRIRFFPDNPGAAYVTPRSFAQDDYVFAYGNSDRDFASLLDAAGSIPARILVLSQTYRPPAALPGNVSWMTRRLPQEELIETIGRAKAVVIPVKSHSLAAGQNAMLEVMCLRRPLVVTCNTATREHAEDGRDALFVPPGDPAALAMAVNRILDDPGLARALGENARQAALSFLDLQVRIFNQVLDGLLAGRKSDSGGGRG